MEAFGNCGASYFVNISAMLKFESIFQRGKEENVTLLIVNLVKFANFKTLHCSQI